MDIYLSDEALACVKEQYAAVSYAMDVELEHIRPVLIGLGLHPFAAHIVPPTEDPLKGFVGLSFIGTLDGVFTLYHLYDYLVKTVAERDVDLLELIEMVQYVDPVPGFVVRQDTPPELRMGLVKVHTLRLEAPTHTELTFFKDIISEFLVKYPVKPQETVDP